eukprot:4709971-Ditylum_brightwellii.AAC.1
MVAEYNDNPKPEYSVTMLNFQMYMHTLDLPSAEFLINNLGSYHKQSILRAIANGKGKEPRLLETGTMDGMISDFNELIEPYIKEGESACTVSIAVDVTKVPCIKELSMDYKAIIGRTIPNHMICVKEKTTKQISKILKDEVIESATEIKIKQDPVMLVPTTGQNSVR